MALTDPVAAHTGAGTSGFTSGFQHPLFGFDHLLAYLLYASIFGGMLTMAIISFRVVPLPPGLAELDWVKRLYRADGGVPYGIALAAAALLVYPDTAWMHPG